MLKSNLTLQPNRISEAAIHASRQMWLASLGAAVVTRDWVQTEAGGVFKTLVKEGTVIESRAIRFVGDRIETSVSFANSVWKETRKTVESTVKQAAEGRQGEEGPRRGEGREAPGPYERSEAGKARAQGCDEARVIR